MLPDDTAVAESRRKIHEALVGSPAWTADTVREELARLEAAVAAHTREQVAQEIETHPGPILYRPDLDEDGGFWWDTRDRDAAAQIARRALGAGQ